MKWKIDPLEYLIWALAAVILVAVSLAVGHCECLASVDECIAASCRVRAGSSRGSGVCIANRPWVVWVLTNNHVVGDLDAAECEFWWKGTKSNPIAGTVIWREKSKEVDAAIIQIDRRSFWGRVPPALPLAPPDYVYPRGLPAFRVSCPGGQDLRVVQSKFDRYYPEKSWMMLTPKANGGESGSGVFDARGNYLLGLIAWSWPKYGATHALAQDTRLLHTRLHPLADRRFRPAQAWDQVRETAITDSGLCDRFRQKPTPKPTPGTSPNPYPSLPGYGPEPMVDEAAREEINALSAELGALKADLADKEARLQRLFGEDYELMKEIAADAKAAKEPADGAVEDVAAVADTLTSVAKAVAEIPEVDVEAEIEDKFGIFRDAYAKLQLRIEEAQAEGAEGVREVARTVVWGIAKTYGWPIGGALGLALFLLWRRKQPGESVVERVRDLPMRLTNRLRGIIEQDEEESLLGRFASRFRGPDPPATPPAA